MSPACTSRMAAVLAAVLRLTKEYTFASRAAAGFSSVPLAASPKRAASMSEVPLPTNGSKMKLPRGA